MPPTSRLPGDGHNMTVKGNGTPPGARQPLDPAVDGRHLKELLGVLRRNAWLVMGITAGIFAISAYLALSSRPTYQAHAVIRLADVRRAYIGGFDDYSTQSPLGRTTNLITSELEILVGRAVLGEVVDREGLRLMVGTGSDMPSQLLTDVRVHPNAPPARLQLAFAPRGYVIRGGGNEVGASYGTPVELADLRFTLTRPPRRAEAELFVISREEAIDYLAASLQVVPRGNTNAVSVRYISMDPHYARKVVNTAVEVFRDYSARSARQQAELRREFLEEQLRKNEVQLGEAQQAFGAFQAREQVYSSGDRLSTQEQDLLALDMRRGEMDAERRMYASLLAAFEGSATAARAQALRTLVSAPGMASNPVVYQLYAQRANYESRIDSLTLGTLGSTQDHPDVRRLRNLIDSAEIRVIAGAQSHVDALTARIAALDELRERSAAQMRRLPEAHAEELRLTQQLEGLTRTRDKLATELHEARMAEAVEMGQVEIVYLAPLPIRPASAGPARMLGVGLVLGLIFGCVGAFLRETLDTTIRSRDGLEDALRLPVLALIPLLASPPGRSARIRQWVVAKGAHSPSGLLRPDRDWPYGSTGIEAYRMLRSHLVSTRSRQTFKRLVVTSASADEGATTTAVNLAFTFAQQGARVLLVDCDCHASRIHEVLRTAREQMLAETVPGGVLLDEAVRPTEYEGIFLLTAASACVSPGTHFNEQALADSLDRLSLEFDLIIIDTPPALDAADAALIGRMADGCILVVRAGKTERGIAQQAQRQLALVGARLIGAVLNDPDARVNIRGRPTASSVLKSALRPKPRPAAVSRGGTSATRGI
jgi:polysaccharide biosynthesis transport protein